MPVMGTGALVEYSDFAMNVSNKVFTVPAGKYWRVVHVWAKLTSTNGAGNRQLDVHVLNALGNLVGIVRSGAVQVASRTQYYSWAPGQIDATAFAPNADNGTMIRNLGAEIMLLSGYTLRVWDSAAIAATADDLSVTILVQESAQPYT